MSQNPEVMGLRLACDRIREPDARRIGRQAVHDVLCTGTDICDRPALDLCPTCGTERMGLETCGVCGRPRAIMEG